MKRSLSIHTPHGAMHGQLDLPDMPRGLVLLARSHHTAVDPIIAANFVTHNFAVLTMELLTTQEARFVDATQNVPRLTQRLLDLLDLIRQDGDMQDLPLAIFASGDCSPAAIRVAAQRDTQVQAVACHGGLIDRAGLEGLKLLVAPLLTLFDSNDDMGRAAFQRAANHLICEHKTHSLEIGEDPVTPAVIWFSKLAGRRPQD
ncbi:MAG: hypothetical protein CVU16_06490 [Betaproteobacteria bacterium HGW-Betaproteobacteria-10]|nr:MAG: hypothetical protein CVU16_06490 [Betaproteobacteria bacterium HGW-Betaproteobacteria-10]